jgi:hypothetical protein
MLNKQLSDDCFQVAKELEDFTKKNMKKFNNQNVKKETNMKKALYFTAATAVLCSAFAGGIYASQLKTETEKQLDACAKLYDVYECKMVAMPVKDYSIVKTSPDLLPPPVDGNEAGF